MVVMESQSLLPKQPHPCHYKGCSLGFLSSQAGESSLEPVTPAAPCERQTLPGAALRWFLLEHPIVVTIVLLLKGKPSLGSMD